MTSMPSLNLTPAMTFGKVSNVDGPDWQVFFLTL
jgi:hypothetical protein